MIEKTKWRRTKGGRKKEHKLKKDERKMQSKEEEKRMGEKKEIKKIERIRAK